MELFLKDLSKSLKLFKGVNLYELNGETGYFIYEKCKHALFKFGDLPPSVSAPATH